MCSPIQLIQGIGTAVSAFSTVKSLFGGGESKQQQAQPVPQQQIEEAPAKATLIPDRESQKRKAELDLAKRRGAASGRVKTTSFSDSGLLGD